MLAPGSPVDAERAWSAALASIAADLDAERFERITPERFPIHLGPVPPSLAARVADLQVRLDAAIGDVQRRMAEVDGELRSSAGRGSRRWAASAPAPSQLDCSA